jgi:hypothetical protein
MSLATALKGAVVDARPRQNSDLRRLWVTQIITMIGAQLHRSSCRPAFSGTRIVEWPAQTALQGQTAPPCREASRSRISLSSTMSSGSEASASCFPKRAFTLWYGVTMKK